MAQPYQVGMTRTGTEGKLPLEDRSLLLSEWSKAQGQTEPGLSCAYNQTRECFLGLKVVAGDFTLASLKDWMSTLTPNSGAGIWMNPFRGILATDASAPLDLLYLDGDGRVLDAVEFFPTFHVSPSSPPAASVLALPSHSIFSSQTQRGDRLMVCLADEMEWRLAQLEDKGNASLTNPSQRPVLIHNDSKRSFRSTVVREEPVKAPDPIAPAIPKPSVQQEPPAQGRAAGFLDGRPIKPPRSWLERWLFPEPSDPRRAPRLPAIGLTAHFFTGGAPQAHPIRDISSSGLYVVTTERWYPGTLIRMTLSKPDVGQHPADRSITIHARSVRWGNDGVGLEFILAAPRKIRSSPSAQLEPVDSQQLENFLKKLDKGGD